MGMAGTLQEGGLDWHRMSLELREGMPVRIQELACFTPQQQGLLLSRMRLMNDTTLELYLEGQPSVIKARLSELLQYIIVEDAERQAKKSPYQKPPRYSNREKLAIRRKQVRGDPTPERLCNGLQLTGHQLYDGGMNVSHGMLNDRAVLVKWADVGTEAGDRVVAEYSALEGQGPLVHLWNVCVPALLCGGYDLPHHIICVAVTPVIEGHNPDENSQEWLLTALQGLQSIHDAGIAHGDICPENIIIDRTSGKVFFVGWENSMPCPTEAEQQEDERKLYEAFGRRYPGSRGTSSVAQAVASLNI